MVECGCVEGAGNLLALAHPDEILHPVSWLEFTGNQSIDLWEHFSHHFATSQVMLEGMFPKAKLIPEYSML